MEKPKLHPIRLTADYWPGESHMDEATGLLVEERIKAGQVIHVPAEQAMKLIAEHKAERADPLPS